eukprot:g81795.t1
MDVHFWTLLFEEARRIFVAHYAAVGECLIATLAAALGPSFDEPVRQAWTMVYELVSTVMILAMEPRTEQDLLITVPVNNKFVEAEAVKHLQIALASRPDKKIAVFSLFDHRRPLFSGTFPRENTVLYGKQLQGLGL